MYMKYSHRSSSRIVLPYKKNKTNKKKSTNSTYTLAFLEDELQKVQCIKLQLEEKSNEKNVPAKLLQTKIKGLNETYNFILEFFKQAKTTLNLISTLHSIFRIAV